MERTSSSPLMRTMHASACNNKTTDMSNLKSASYYILFGCCWNCASCGSRRFVRVVSTALALSHPITQTWRLSFAYASYSDMTCALPWGSRSRMMPLLRRSFRNPSRAPCPVIVSGECSTILPRYWKNASWEDSHGRNPLVAALRPRGVANGRDTTLHRQSRLWLC